MYRPVLVLGLIALVSLPATAQENTIGLGVSIEPDLFATSNDGRTPLSMPTLYIPFTARGFRFEPSLGFSRTAVSFDGESDSASTLRLGAGLFFYRLTGDSNAWYIGTRVGLIRFGPFDSFDDDGVSRVDYFVAPTLGGEHYFGKLSVGVEGQVSYTRVGSFNENSEASTSIFQSRALIFLRYHFGSWNNS